MNPDIVTRIILIHEFGIICCDVPLFISNVKGFAIRSFRHALKQLRIAHKRYPKIQQLLVVEFVDLNDPVSKTVHDLFKYTSFDFSGAHVIDHKFKYLA